MRVHSDQKLTARERNEVNRIFAGLGRPIEFEHELPETYSELRQCMLSELIPHTEKRAGRGIRFDEWPA